MRENFHLFVFTYLYLICLLNNLRVGIIGQPLSQFNPMTLTPIDADNEEDNRDEGESSPTPRRELVDIWIIFFISNLYTLLE